MCEEGAILGTWFGGRHVVCEFVLFTAQRRAVQYVHTCIDMLLSLLVHR